jgi:phosphoglucosamine mutase
MTRENSKIFGTDGVRGRANHFPMTPEIALALGRAVGKVFSKQVGKSRIVIGKDTRLSCYVFENALIAGLCSMGIDTFMVGPLPTPGVAFITRAYRADAGIVISASHNAFHDNGIKFFDSQGYKLPDEWEVEIERIINCNDYESSLPREDDLGKNAKIADADGRYIEYAKATFPRRLSLKNLRIALDCANGAGYRVAPLIFRELDAKVFAFGITPNGLNINEGCGSTYIEPLQRNVIEHRADVGIALDGDGDRLVMVDEKGNVIDGDTILAICAKDLQRRGLLKNNRIVGTVMSNLGFIQSMREIGIEVITSPVGDRYVIQDMLKHDAILGGEQSGHMIFLEYNTTGDGLVAALQVLRIMIETDSKLSDLASFVKHYPQICLNVKVASKPSLDGIPELAETIKSVESVLGESGRVLVRYSGTENICRVMVEGIKQNEILRLAESIGTVVRHHVGS